MSHVLDFPIAAPPGPGEVVEASPGFLWARLPLPFRLDHVNVYLIADGEGYALVDAGLDSSASRAAWESLLAGPLAGRRLTRLIVTHFDPDHIGLAGWLAERFGLAMAMSQTEYLAALTICARPAALQSEPYRSFYRSHGLDAAHTELLLGAGLAYLTMVSPPPRTFGRLIDGDRLTIGGRAFEVLTGAGHSPEQVMLHEPTRGVLISGDQIMAKISPNISVEAMDPEGDPLGAYLRSLKRLSRRLSPDVLVLPGHNLPFVGLRRRVAELETHHEARCAAIAEACAAAPHTVAELVPVVFGRAIADPHQMTFAFSEALAHANYLLRRGRLRAVERGGGVALVAEPAG